MRPSITIDNYEESNTTKAPAITFDPYKGSNDGYNMVKGQSSQKTDLTAALIEVTHFGVYGIDEDYLRANIVLSHDGAGIVKKVGSCVRAAKVCNRVGFGYVHKCCE